MMILTEYGTLVNIDRVNAIRIDHLDNDLHEIIADFGKWQYKLAATKQEADADVILKGIAKAMAKMTADLVVNMAGIEKEYAE